MVLILPYLFLCGHTILSIFYTELADLGGRRQQFIAQINENGMVKQELDILEEDDAVFKLVGPILVKQDLADAKSNVEKRLEFINNELYVNSHDYYIQQP